jgi:hypothetical protein
MTAVRPPGLASKPGIEMAHGGLWAVPEIIPATSGTPPAGVWAQRDALPDLPHLQIQAGPRPFPTAALRQKVRARSAVD